MGCRHGHPDCNGQPLCDTCRGPAIPDQLVLSPMALRNLLRRAHDGEQPDDLLRVCIDNASPVMVQPAFPALPNNPLGRTQLACGCNAIDVKHVGHTCQPTPAEPQDGGCPCRRPWCGGDEQQPCSGWRGQHPA